MKAEIKSIWSHTSFVTKPDGGSFYSCATSNKKTNKQNKILNIFSSCFRCSLINRDSIDSTEICSLLRWDSGLCQAPAGLPCSRDLLGGLCGCAPSGSPCEQISSHTLCKRRASSPCERPVGGPSSSRCGQNVYHTERSQKAAPQCVCECELSARREWGSSFHKTDRDAVGPPCGATGVCAGGRGMWNTWHSMDMCKAVHSLHQELEGGWGHLCAVMWAPASWTVVSEGLCCPMLELAVYDWWCLSHPCRLWVSMVTRLWELGVDPAEPPSARRPDPARSSDWSPGSQAPGPGKGKNYCHLHCWSRQRQNQVGSRMRQCQCCC